jgi:hypothetical protein
MQEKAFKLETVKHENSMIPRTVPLQSVKEQLLLGSNASSTSKHSKGQLNTYSAQYQQQQHQQHGLHNQNIHQVQSSQIKKNQLQEWWSSPPDLSPIQDVSPSLEAAEQKSMEMGKQSSAKEVI